MPRTCSSLLLRPLADPEVSYVCGRLAIRLAILDADGVNEEGAYWRDELWPRANESALHSVTGGNGSIYAVRREAYGEVHPSMGHDLSLPYRMVQAGGRAVYEPAAVASEKPSTDTEEEYRRKVRMFEHCWLIVLRGKMLRRLPPLYLAAILSHRHLRYLSGLLHIAALVLNIALVATDPGSTLFWATLAAQAAALGLALLGRLRAPVPFAALAWYYTLVSCVTTKALAAHEASLRHPRRRPRPRPRGPCPRARCPRHQARGSRPRPLPAEARRQGLRGVRAAQAAQDGAER